MFFFVSMEQTVAGLRETRVYQMNGCARILMYIGRRLLSAFKIPNGGTNLSQLGPRNEKFGKVELRCLMQLTMTLRHEARRAVTKSMKHLVFLWSVATGRRSQN